MALLAESAEREAWKLAALQLGDLLKGEWVLMSGS